MWRTEDPLPGAALLGAQVLLIEAQPVDGVRPVAAPARRDRVFSESGCLGMQPKAGGKLHLRLNTGTRPIVDKRGATPNQQRRAARTRCLRREAVEKGVGDAGGRRPRAPGPEDPRAAPPTAAAEP
ncbi:hypothetical protein JRQ81_009615 [Phrynocephalus forsythii]|uniref:Uncharacterized protein n=1 Tax=Phrynocephalus forsythii TaxID=171643 RepID=A0A9Q0XA91_9SAUR|nr:hypothetical protein JRQ81_009615 [Phrynocephalus forsythii]